MCDYILQNALVEQFNNSIFFLLLCFSNRYVSNARMTLMTTQFRARRVEHKSRVHSHAHTAESSSDRPSKVSMSGSAMDSSLGPGNYPLAWTMRGRRFNCKPEKIVCLYFTCGECWICTVSMQVAWSWQSTMLEKITFILCLLLPSYAFASFAVLVRGERIVW